jgi:purine-binding chemotaxis protein CheW
MTEVKVKKEEACTYFIFQVAKELFAVEVGRVRNVLELIEASRIPETPDYLMGIINVQGDLLPVVEARKKFNLKGGDYSRDACILSISIESKSEKFRLGLKVDRARDVLKVQKNEIESVPDMGLNLNPDYVKGIINKNQEIIFILDIDEIFSHEEVTAIKNLESNQKDE